MARKDSQAPITIDTATAAKLIQVTPRYVQHLAKQGWFSAVARDCWNVVDIVQGYIAMLKATAARRQDPAKEKLDQAKAELIEARLAREDADLVTLSEALSFTDELSGAYLDSLARFPALITKEPRERQRIEAIVGDDCKRLSEKWAVLRDELRTGKAAKHRALELED